jgi:nucleoside phosphorylase
MRTNIRDLKDNVDFAIITIREDEFRAVLARFPTSEYAFGKTRYDVGNIQTATESYTFAVIRCIRPGEAEAQRVVEYIKTDLASKLLVLVGIGGACPSADWTLGDVVCATSVHDFSIRAIADGQLDTFHVVGGEMHEAIVGLLRNLPRVVEDLDPWNTREALGREVPRVELNFRGAVYGERAWRDRVRKSIKRHFPDGKPAHPPIATARPVASGSTLMKSTSEMGRWLQQARDLAAVEMELGGVFLAAGREIPILAIRGISDIVGFRRDEEWTRFACESAASFASELIRSGALTDVLASHQSLPKIARFHSGWEPYATKVLQRGLAELFVDVVPLLRSSDAFEVVVSLSLGECPDELEGLSVVVGLKEVTLIPHYDQCKPLPGTRLGQQNRPHPNVKFRAGVWDIIGPRGQNNHLEGEPLGPNALCEIRPFNTRRASLTLVLRSSRQDLEVTSRDPSQPLSVCKQKILQAFLQKCQPRDADGMVIWAQGSVRWRTT